MSGQKEAVEKLRQLMNTNYADNKFKIDVDYDNCLSKAETSLLTANK